MNIFIKMRHLWSTDVSLIRLGEDGDEHCEGAVVIKDSQDQPNPGERDSRNATEYKRL